MLRWNAEKQRMQCGFTLTELMIVVAVALVIAAVAVPNVISGMRHLRLRSTASSIVGILQQARQRAVRDNRNYQVLWTNAAPGMNNVPVLFIDLNWNNTYERPEPLVELPGDVVLRNASPITNQQLERAISPSAPLGQQLVIIYDTGSRATAPTFNARGRACRPTIPNPPDAITICNPIVPPGFNQVAHGIYLQSTTLGADGWAAVSVSHGGRIKRWAYDEPNGNWR